MWIYLIWLICGIVLKLVFEMCVGYDIYNMLLVKKGDFDYYGMILIEVIFLIVFSCVICMIGMFLNVFLMIVVFLMRELWKRYMVVFLISMLVIDIIICVVYELMYIYDINYGFSVVMEKVCYRFGFCFFLVLLNG